MEKTIAAPKRKAVVSAPPEILKLDPPGWWAGHTINPVRLMIRGKNLHGARVACASPGVRLGPVKISASGTTLFVDAKIAPKAASGEVVLRITTAGGAADAAFEVLRPQSKKARAGFSSDDVIYLIMPDRFANGDPAHADPAKWRGTVDRAKSRSFHGGDLKGIIDRLPYLKELGATAIWLTPLYANLDGLHPTTSWSKVPFTDYHGYGPVDYYGVDPHFGGLDDLRALVDKAHALGLKIILDQVSNHTSPAHPWVQDWPTATWYHGTLEKHTPNTFHTWAVADPYASDELRGGILDGWFGDFLPDLNQDDPEMARYMIQNVLWWVAMSGADAMRHDVVGLVPRAFWKKCFAALKRAHPGIRAVGEVNGDSPAFLSQYQTGRPAFDGLDIGLDSVFDFPLRKALRDAFLDGKSMENIPALLSQDRLYPDPMRLVTCVGLHDDSRFMGHPAATPEALKLALCFILTTRGIPLIYYGDEIALRGGEDPDNRRDFPGGWRDDPRDAFTRAGRTPEEQDVFDHVARLVSLRADFEPLRRGRLVNLAVGERTYAYARVTRSSCALVILNTAAEPRAVEFSADALRLPPRTALLEDRLGRTEARVENGRIKAVLPARTAAIYTLSKP
ncbi:MAG: hypothetical protein A2506_08705 [Elusimicrobia bacterium RIFOXYD12_FULL_66_9]|nr:MAG: hypothetical protein A2506_08705 [Elusimicrobia bacterium RIFOXYD12_FULL_66_9]